MSALSTFVRLAALLVSFIAGAAAAAAQPAPDTDTAAPPGPDPIRCWWRTSAGFVATGEPFAVVLTCAVLDTNVAQAIVDESQLAVGTVQLAPYEVLGGTHPADLKTDQRRFFQYQYTIRIIDPDLIGRDVKLPDVQIHYRVHQTAGGDSVEGRDQVYILPGIPVRVASLVPIEASDIRDGADESFGVVQLLRFRGRLLRLTAIALVALALVALVPALGRLAARQKQAATPRAALMPEPALLRSLSSELHALEQATRQGWTSDQVARAALAGRIAAACALGRRTSQKPLEQAPDGGEYRLLVERGLLRRRRVAVSSPVLSSDIAATLSREEPAMSARRRETLERLHAALRTFTAVLYGANARMDDSSLDEALRGSIEAVAHLRRARAWPRQLWATRFGRVASPETVA